MKKKTENEKRNEKNEKRIRMKHLKEITLTLFEKPSVVLSIVKVEQKKSAYTAISYP